MIDGENRMSSPFGPAGYSSTWFQDSTTRFTVDDPPEEKFPVLVSIAKSRSASTAAAPSGTSRWYSYTSCGPRFHGIVFPPALKVSPTMSTIGPVGPCSPGSHFGYASVIG